MDPNWSKLFQKGLNGSKWDNYVLVGPNGFKWVHRGPNYGSKIIINLIGWWCYVVGGGHWRVCYQRGLTSLVSNIPVKLGANTYSALHDGANGSDLFWHQFDEFHGFWKGLNVLFISTDSSSFTQTNIPCSCARSCLFYQKISKYCVNTRPWGPWRPSRVPYRRAAFLLGWKSSLGNVNLQDITLYSTLKFPVVTLASQDCLMGVSIEFIQSLRHTTNINQVHQTIWNIPGQGFGINRETVDLFWVKTMLL